MHTKGTSLPMNLLTIEVFVYNSNPGFKIYFPYFVISPIIIDISETSMPALFKYAIKIRS